MRNPVRLVIFVVAIFCAGIAIPASAWEHWGGDRGGSRFSPLNQITPDNVGNLIRAWEFRTGDLDTRAPEVMKRTKFQATPLLIEDSLVFCSPFNEVIALDPGSGAPKWRYDPKISTDQRPANRYNCRGVAYWADDKAPDTAACRTRIFMGTNDARVIALDARTGIPCADFGANGEIRIETGMPLDWPGEFQITSPPVIVRDTVVVGSAIADNRRVEAPPGTVRAFDARTGRPRWSFDPLVHDGVTAGHANVWAPMSVDEDRGLVFLPTSSPSPDFWGGKRPGNNDYANSVVALRAESGERVWSYQTVHHDVWDYDLPAQPTLARIDAGEGPRDVVIQPTKQGFVFVLDRDTGKPIWPVEERAVPQGGAEGEQLSPTQPYPTHVPSLLSQQISADDVFGLIPFWERNACRAQVAAARNEGLYTPPSTQGTVVFPMTGGGVNWGGAAFDPVNQILYANVSRAIHIVKLLPRAAVPDGFNPPPRTRLWTAARRAVRDDARDRVVAHGPAVQQAALGRDGRAGVESRKDPLAFARRHHGRSRAARHRAFLWDATRQWRGDHCRRSRLHRRGRRIFARFRRAIGAGVVAGPAAGAWSRQSHDLSVEGRAIRRDRRRRSFGVGYDHRRQRGGVPPGAAGRSALAVVTHHRPAGRAIHERGDRSRVCDRTDGAVAVAPAAAPGGGVRGIAIRLSSNSPRSSSGLTGRSSTPRLPGSIIGVSGILDRPPSRTMTTEYDLAFPRRVAPEVYIFVCPLFK
jgi:quinoprotein glucose dehydrogenase